MTPKIIAASLLTAILITLLPVSAFAQESDSAAESNNTEDTETNNEGEIENLEDSESKESIPSENQSAIYSTLPAADEPLPVGETDVNKIATTDLQSGSFKFSKNIKLPSGVNGLSPSLSIDYDSHERNTNSSVGFGWMLSSPKIERVNKRGINYLYDKDKEVFHSSLHGELVPLDIDSNNYGTYQPKIQTGIYTYYNYSENGWTTTDNDGTQYLFGSNENSRKANPLTANEVFSWHISEIMDSNSNSITFSYLIDNSEIYLEQIDYNPYSIILDYEDRPDQIQSYETKFFTRYDFRLKSIKIFFNEKQISDYILNYKQSISTRSLLETIQHKGYDSNGNSELEPPTTFEYNEKEPGPAYTKVEGFLPPTQGPIHGESLGDVFIPNDSNRRIEDINGDGIDDYINWSTWHPTFHHELGAGVVANADMFPQYGIWLSNGTGFEKTGEILMPNYEHPAYGPYYIGNVPDNRSVDLNGDRLFDILGWDEYGSSSAWINTGLGFIEGIEFTPPSHESTEWGGFPRNDRTVPMVDINADGLDDFIVWSDVSSAPGVGSGYINNRDAYPHIGIWINTGEGFEKENEYLAPTQGYKYGETYGEVYASYDYQNQRFVDLNGDGLIDYLNWQGSRPVSETDANPNYGVWINTGQKFKKDNNFSLPKYTQHSGVESYISNTPEIKFLDINADGLTDIYNLDRAAMEPTEEFSYQDCLPCGAWINTGSGFIQDKTLFLPPYYSQDGENKIIPYQEDTILGDFNGDNLIDFMHWSDEVDVSERTGAGFVNNIGEYGYNGVWLNNTSPEYLNKITLNTGGIIEPTFKYSTEDERNPDLPISLLVVDEIKYSDGISKNWSESYIFEEGNMYFNGNYQDRKFTGFGKATHFDGNNNKTITYKHQGNENRSASYEHNDDINLAGYTYRTEIFDDSDKLFQILINKYEAVPLGGETSFNQLNEVITLNLNGTGAIKSSTAERFEYNASNGTLHSHTQMGFVNAEISGEYTDTANDTRIHEYEYATNENLIKESRYILTNLGGQKLSETISLYDGLPVGSISRGNVSQIKKKKNNNEWITVSYRHDLNGNIISETDSNNNSTTYTYDEYGLMPITTKSAEPFNFREFTQYNYLIQKPKKTLGYNGESYRYNYDPLGRLKEIYKGRNFQNESLITEYNYDTTSTPQKIRITKYQNPNPQINNEIYFDGFLRTILTKDEYSGSKTSYDNEGNIEFSSLPYEGANYSNSSPTGITTQTKYNPLGQVVSIKNSLGTSTMSYNGNKVIFTDKLNRSTEYRYDAFGNLIKVTNPKGSTTRYRYDERNLLTGIVDAENTFRTYSYNIAGQLIQATLPRQISGEQSNYKYKYDNRGNIIQINTPNDHLVLFQYDSLNRLISSKEKDSPAYKYIYDNCQNGQGNLCGVKHQGIEETYKYNPYGSVKEIKRYYPSLEITLKSNTTYDIQEQPISVENDGITTNYEYNNRGLVSKIKINDTQEIANFIYAPHGMATEVEFSNGTSTEYEYDNNNNYRLTSLYTLNPLGNYIQKQQIKYDNESNITEVDDSDGLSQSIKKYSYDKLNQLISSETITPDETIFKKITYSPTGRIKSNELGTLQYTNPSHPHAVTSFLDKTYTYDFSGNQISDGSTAHQYDYRNKIINSTLSDGTQIENIYDSSGMRIFQNIVGPELEKQIFTLNSQYELIKENDAEKKIVTISSPKLRIATLELEGELTNLTFQHLDHLGSTKYSTNAEGEIIEQLDYNSFGEIESSSGEQETRKKFTGHTYDSETGLTYMLARYYDSQTGRFTSQDPALFSITDDMLENPLTLNPYTYALNNPIKMIDPDGRKAINYKSLGAAAYYTFDAYMEASAGAAAIAINVGAFKLSKKIGVAVGPYLGSVAAMSFDQSKSSADNAIHNYKRAWNNEAPEIVSEKGPIRTRYGEKADFLYFLKLTSDVTDVYKADKTLSNVKDTYLRLSKTVSKGSDEYSKATKALFTSGTDFTYSAGNTLYDTKQFIEENIGSEQSQNQQFWNSTVDNGSPNSSKKDHLSGWFNSENGYSGGGGGSW